MGTFENALAPEVHQGGTFGVPFVRAIQRYAARTAIVFAGRAISYSEMGDQIARIKQVLRDKGIGRGTGVCVLMSNRPEAIFIRVALHLLGARYVPLNPKGATADHRFILADSESDYLILEPGLATAPITDLASAAIRTILICCDGTSPDDLMNQAAACIPAPLSCEAHADDIAALTYTGGTTGRPKGVIHSHRTLLANLLMCLAEWDWPQRPKMLLMTPLSHAAGLLTAPTFVKGGSIHLVDGFHASTFIEIVEQERISATFLVPTMIHAIATHAQARPEAFASLGLVIYGAAPISQSLLKQAIALFGPVMLQLYAQTEAPMTVTTLNIDDHADPARQLSCGFPMAGVDVRLLDEDDNEVAVGDVGEICVRGPVVADGYWKRPDETAATFRGGWLHTGDLARADHAGYLFIVDRKKDMIISGGFNVYPKEVEDVLSSHPDVAQVAVFGVPDARWGEAVKAAVVLRPGCHADLAALAAFVRERKGAVCTPKSIDVHDSLPLTAVGKPDKQALRTPYWRDITRKVS